MYHIRTHKILPEELYFAKNSRTWDNKGVAFIKSASLPNYEKKVTLGRKYLITKNQFIQIVRQENNSHVDDASIGIDFDIAGKEPQYLIGEKNKCRWYGRLINLGTSEGILIFTFTAKWNDEFDEYILPSDNYLKKITGGLKEAYRLADNEIVDYLVSIPGIYGNKTREELKVLVTTNNNIK